jgi:sulfate permease, SulP family
VNNTAADDITTDDSANGHISGEAGDAAAGTAGAVFREIVAVLAVSLSAVGQAVSMAVLVFSGSLDEGLPRAIAAFVIAGGIVSAYIAMTSRLVPAGSVIQDSPAIVLVAVAASVAARGGPDPVSNVFVLLALTGALTGSMMWLLGRVRLGALVRYMPTTVVGAFMAGTGWLLTKGGLDVAAGFSVELGDVGELFTIDVAKFWVPGVALGVLIWLIGRSDRLPLSAMSMTILASLGVFYLVVAVASSFSAVESGGWLIGPFPDGAKPSIVTAQELTNAGWSEILTSFAGIVSVVAVSIMVVLLNVTALESKSSERLDVNAELRSAGVANVLCAPLGVAPGFHGLADTTLIKQLGATRRTVPVAAGALLVVFGAFGVGIIGLVPRLVVGAMLITVGLALLADWVSDLIRSVSKTEQLLSVAIVVVIAAVGILEGIAVGVVAACAVFIVRYSRVDPIRIVRAGHDMRSRVDRGRSEVELLAQHAARRVVFELQGYLFFGSIASLEDRILALTGEFETDELDAVILDFRAVTGIDTSGYELIGQMARHVNSKGALVVMSSVNLDLRNALIAAETESLGNVTWTATLDEGLEASERVQLQRYCDPTEISDEAAIELSSALVAEFTHRTFSSGDVVMKHGATSDGMFLLIKGTMTAFQVEPDGTRHRLRSFGRAAMVGEIGLILGGPRTAEIVADSEAEVLWLSADRYRELRTVCPELAFELHEYILGVQAGLVVSLSEGLARSAR